jgi:hypothetical protein
MARRSRQMVVFYYDPEKRRVWGKAGQFLSLEEWAKYPPSTQDDTIPPSKEPSIPDRSGVPQDPGPEIKCIDGKEYVCYLSRCYPTGRDC